MIRLRRYASRVQAEHAAMFLRRHGLEAVVVGDYVHAILGKASPKLLQVELMLLEEDRKEEAEGLLDEFESSPIELTPGWEEESEPDVSELDLAAFDLTCPSCQRDLRRDDPVGVCADCGAEYDFLGLIVSRHGPEALEDLYEQTDMTLSASIYVKRQRCKDCGHDITKLPTRDRCPSCGRLFDKELE